MMRDSEETFTHANCGGEIRRDPQTGRYTCEKCRGEAEQVISASQGGAGRPEEVLLCDPHGQSI